MTEYDEALQWLRSPLSDLADLNSLDETIAPALMFKISRNNAIVCNVLRQWEKGLLDWEQALKTIISLTEQHIKKMSEDPNVQEFITRKALLSIPVLKSSLMPSEDKNATPLARQESLIKACYVLNEIQKTYLTIMMRSVSGKLKTVNDQ